MQTKSKLFFGALAALSLAVPTTTRAAYLAIDDSDPNTITISAGDFEEGFYVDGNLLTIGLGSGNSITLPDAGYTLSGKWIDLGLTTPGSQVRLLFVDAGDPTAVMSGVELTANSDGFLGDTFGSSGGYTGIPYFFVAELTYPQNGPTQNGSFPFLSISFTPEHPGVPDGGSSALLLALAAGTLSFAARRKSA